MFELTQLSQGSRKFQGTVQYLCTGFATVRYLPTLRQDNHVLGSQLPFAIEKRPLSPLDLPTYPSADGRECMFEVP